MSESPRPDGVRLELRSGVGRLTLDRPEALNALTTPMVTAINHALHGWADTARVVIIDSACPKAFCAGGDIRAVCENALAGAHQANEKFFATEYSLNARIAEYPAPVVSLIDGICMGGGMGLSIHGTFRLVTERALLAMPETAIGFFPDVGASHFLSRLPGALGTYLGLTGYRLDAADALYTGLATHMVPALSGEELQNALIATPENTVEQTLRELAGPTTVGASTLAEHRAEIDWGFGAPTLDGIHTRLADMDTEWSRQARTQLGMASPQSLRVTFDLLAWARQHSLRESLAAELALTRDITITADFAEGVRAALVDKDRSPRWSSARYVGLNGAGHATWRHTIPTTERSLI